MEFYRIFHPVSARGCYSHVYYCHTNDVEINTQHLNYLKDMAMRHGHVENSRKTPCLFDDDLIHAGWSNNRNEDDAPIYQIFCFSSIKQMLDWFTFEELEELHNIGFKLAKFECDVYNLYKKQCTIPLNTFKECEIISVTSLLNVIGEMS